MKALKLFACTLTLASTFSFPCELLAQPNPNVIVRISDVTGAVGSTVKVEVTLEILPGGPEVINWLVPVCHDKSVLTLLDAVYVVDFPVPVVLLPNLHSQGLSNSAEGHHHWQLLRGYPAMWLKKVARKLNRRKPSLTGLRDAE